MRTSSEHDGNGEDTSVDDPEREDLTVPMQVRGPDIFVTVRAPRRELLPASLRRGRHRAKDARRAQARANHPCNGTPRMYLVDGEGEFEETRIAVRRRFEDLSVTPTPHPQETAAG